MALGSIINFAVPLQCQYSANTVPFLVAFILACVILFGKV